MEVRVEGRDILVAVGGFDCGHCPSLSATFSHVWKVPLGSAI